MVDFPLTKANRIKLVSAYSDTPRVDLGIDCALEGQMGRAWVDNVARPKAFKIGCGPFCYFAGDSGSASGREMLEELAPFSIVMPSSEGWVEEAKKVHGDRLIQFNRYSYSSEYLSVDHLATVLHEPPFVSEIVKVDAATASKSFNDPEAILDISAFDSSDDFLSRGIGYCLMKRDLVAGVAFSSLVCSKGIEVSIFVVPKYRRMGAATALACFLLRDSLEKRLDPHWDAANLESCRLAEKLGYVQTGTYDAYFLRE